MNHRIRFYLIGCLGLTLALAGAAGAEDRAAQTQPSSAEASKPAASASAKPAAKTRTSKKKATKTVAPAEHIQVQHVLIGFKGSVPGKPITRSKEEARKLAYDVLKRAKHGEDFNTLVAKYTDDQPPGIYGMANNGVQPAQGEYPRGGMVPAFGNVGFELNVGEIGIADYDAQKSPFGYHIIKRLK